MQDISSLAAQTRITGNDLIRNLSPEHYRITCNDVSTSRVDQAIFEAGILEDGGSLAWLDHPSNRTLLLALAQLHGDEPYKHGPSLILTHFIWVGHHAANDPHLIDTNATPEVQARDAAMSAFIGLAHDWPEELNMRGLDVMAGLAYAVSLWSGSENEKQAIRTSLLNLTDKPDLHGQERIDAQAAQTKLNSKREQQTRVIDKLQQLIKMDIPYFKEAYFKINRGHAFISDQEIIDCAAEARRFTDKAKCKCAVVAAAELASEAIRKQHAEKIAELESITIAIEDIAKPLIKQRSKQAWLLRIKKIKDSISKRKEEARSHRPKPLPRSVRLRRNYKPDIEPKIAA